MGILKLIFLPIYLPLAIVFGILKVIGKCLFAVDVFKRI